MTWEFLCRGVNGDCGNEDCGVCGDWTGLLPKPLVVYVLGDAEERSRLDGFRRRLDRDSGEEGTDGMAVGCIFLPNCRAQRSVEFDIGGYPSLPRLDKFFSSW